jgi:membrane-bound inhibitor of C-type lysozyme
MIRLSLIALALTVSSTCVLAKGQPKASKKAAVEKILPPADATQLSAAEQTFFGNYECEFKQMLDVGMNPKTPGYVDVVFKGKTHTMKPVVSSTGALRLEDVKGQTLLLQIANKSMLMDIKAGSRLVDDCVHEKQRELSIKSKM